MGARGWAAEVREAGETRSFGKGTRDVLLYFHVGLHVHGYQEGTRCCWSLKGSDTEDSRALMAGLSRAVSSH